MEFLIHHFIENKTKLESVKIEPDALAFLNNYHWEGNVRQLQNIIIKLALFIKDSRITVADLPEKIKASVKNQNLSTVIFPSKSLKERTAEHEKKEIIKDLQMCNYNVTKTARILQVDRRELYRKMKSHDIKIKQMRLLASVNSMVNSPH